MILETVTTTVEEAAAEMAEMPVHQAAAVHAEAAVAAVAEAVVVEGINIKKSTVKKIIIHTAPVLISFLWLILVNHTLNPVSLKGPYFLRFYLILLSGFYVSIFILKLFKEMVFYTTFYFATAIFILGIVKLIRGIYLGKPVGYLLMILMVEIIVMAYVKMHQSKD